MLFNSIEFIFLFLPACVACYAVTARLGRTSAAGVLGIFSVGFYLAWLPYHFFVLFLSICFNFQVARRLAISRGRGLLTFGIAANLVLLGYFKYSAFLAENAARLFGGSGQDYIALAIPLALSFHTFQQIAFLVDCRKGGIRLGTFWDYFLFVMFFPQLISGPITHYRDLSDVLP